MMSATMRWLRSVSALTRAQPTTVSQLRHRPQSLPWNPHVDAVDSKTPAPVNFEAAAADKERPATVDVDGRRERSKTLQARSLSELDGPAGWPIVGNFLTYLKKENRGRMHIIQVRIYTAFKRRADGNRLDDTSPIRAMQENKDTYEDSLRYLKS